MQAETYIMVRYQQPVSVEIVKVRYCNLCTYFAPYEQLYSSTGPVVIVSYGPAPVFRLLGLDTARISVPFSSKGVNHMAYLAHVVTAVWCVLLFV